MKGDLHRRWAQFWDAIAECRRAESEWTRLQSEGVQDVIALLPPKERRHLSHTVFRINALLFLYSRLRGAPHNTRLGVLLGATTHLLDFVYDHPSCSRSSIDVSERAVRDADRDTDSLVARTLHHLASEFWPLISNRSAFTTRLDAMLETQRRSMVQEDGAAVTPDELAQLTVEKGHRSLCLYFSAVNPAFSESEAAALRRLGLYMQYMDDLEDFYEDRAEARTSPVKSPACGAFRATGLLLAAGRDLKLHYGATSLRGYRIFMTWLSAFHVGILAGCASREATRRLPPRIRQWYDRSAERVVERFPFFNVAPLGVSYYDTPGSEPWLPMSLSLLLTLVAGAAKLSRDTQRWARVFGEVVDPLLDASADGEQIGANLRQPLLEWGLKGAYMVDAYARLAGLPTRAPLAVLCGATGRLYDDLLEQSEDPTLPSRLQSLFRNEPFDAKNQYEYLLRALYSAIHDRLARSRSDPVFGALLELHDYQCRTVEQRQGSIRAEALDDITYRKGGLTLQVLYGMTRSELREQDRDLINLAGATLQLLDDYQDEFADRSAGLTTKATRGEIRGRDIWRSLGQLETKLALPYGGRPARRFVNELRIQLFLAALGRRFTFASSSRRDTAQRDRRRPLDLLARRGSNVPIYPVLQDRALQRHVVDRDESVAA